MTTSENNIDQEALLALLPWYLNGTLDEKEQRAVEQLLEHSQSARDELAVLKKIQQQVLSEKTGDAPSELGWQKLKRDIKAADARQVNVTTSKGGGNWYKMAGVAAVLVICVQFGLLWKHTVQPVDVELLGGAQNAQTDILKAEGLYFQARFEETADWQAINALLDAVQGEIIQGPSALGLVTIRVPIKEQEKEAALLDFLATQAVIQHVQLVESE